MSNDKPAPTRQTILVVESENSLRQFVRNALARQGYRVLLSCDGKQALHIAARHEFEIDLLLTDIVLPGFYGWHLAELLKLDYPQLKVIYVVSSTDRNACINLDNYALACESNVIPLHKSGWADILITAVREVLNSSENRAQIGRSSEALSDVRCRDVA